MFFFLLFSQRPWNIESHIRVVKPMPSPQQTEQNAARFNASLKEKLEKLNMSNRPLPNVPSKSQPTLQFHYSLLLFPRNWLCKSAQVNYNVNSLQTTSSAWNKKARGSSKCVRLHPKTNVNCHGKDSKFNGSDTRPNDSTSAPLSAA